MSDTHEVLKMVDIYKKLFLLLVVVTALGIAVSYLHMPLWLGVFLALLIMAVKSKFVIDAFKHLIVGRNLILIIFLLTVIFFIGLLMLPFLNNQGQIPGTEDTSKAIQMQEKPLESHHGN